MGGLAGHMNHLTDNFNLSFGKLKKILSDASNGKLIGTEKLDGMNLYLTFFNEKAFGARNKTDVKNGGLNIEAMINRDFKGGDKIKKSYVAALKSFETICNNIDNKLIESIFDSGSVWYNCELISQGTKNIINYDTNSIVIHNMGTLKRDKVTGDIQPYENANPKLLDKLINLAEQKESNVPFNIRKDAVIKLKGLNNRNDIKIVLARINKIMESSKLSDKNTIGDMIRINIKSLIEKNLPEISKEIKNNIIENILGNEKLSLPLGTSREIRSKIAVIKKESNTIVKKIMFPLEEAISDFAIALLEGLESAFIVNNKKEIQNLRKNVSDAIKTIQSSNDEEKLHTLSIQLQKLKNLDNINTAIEGFVFNYDGVTYKFTGSFAPVNQLINLFRFNQNNDNMVNEENEGMEGSKKIIAAIPGGFKPPHRGHYQVVQHFLNMPEVDEVHIFISEKERHSHGINRKLVITADMSEKIWNIYLKHNPRAFIHVVKGSPVKAVYDFMETMTPGDMYLVGQGKKDEEVDHGRYDGIQKWSDKNNFGVKTKIITTPSFANGINGTKVRYFIAEKKKNEFFQTLPEHLTDKERNAIWNIVNSHVEEDVLKEDFQKDVQKGHEEKKKRLIGGGGQQNTKPYTQKPSMKRSKSAPAGFGALEEESSISSGAIEGSPLINNSEEKYMKSRKNFIEQIMLKEKIRSCIKEEYKKYLDEEMKEITQTNKLRKQIHSILKEIKEQDIIPEPSTGINVLKDLLKKIIPVLEVDYKMLTTSKEQRISFRAHIIRAVQSTLILGQKDVTKGVKEKEQKEKEEGKTESLEEQDAETLSNGERVKINIGGTPVQDIGQDPSQFIDITRKTKFDDDIFTISGSDATGRNMAINSYDKIEKNILTSYQLLGSQNDQYLFIDYLISNLKLYFDKFEAEMSSMVNEPTNQTYEKEIEKQENEEDVSELDAIE